MRPSGSATDAAPIGAPISPAAAQVPLATPGTSARRTSHEETGQQCGGQHRGDGLDVTGRPADVRARNLHIESLCQALSRARVTTPPTVVRPPRRHRRPLQTLLRPTHAARGTIAGAGTCGRVVRWLRGSSHDAPCGECRQLISANGVTSTSVPAGARAQFFTAHERKRSDLHGNRRVSSLMGGPTGDRRERRSQAASGHSCWV